VGGGQQQALIDALRCPAGLLARPCWALAISVCSTKIIRNARLLAYASQVNRRRLWVSGRSCSRPEVLTSCSVTRIRERAFELEARMNPHNPRRPRNVSAAFSAVGEKIGRRFSGKRPLRDLAAICRQDYSPRGSSGLSELLSKEGRPKSKATGRAFYSKSTRISQGPAPESLPVVCCEGPKACLTQKEKTRTWNLRRGVPNSQGTGLNPINVKGLFGLWLTSIAATNVQTETYPGV